MPFKYVLLKSKFPLGNIVSPWKSYMNNNNLRVRNLYLYIIFEIYMRYDTFTLLHYTVICY